MKKIVEVDEKSFESLLGERITLFCANYIYTGKLVGINSIYLVLENPAIVYETGAFLDKQWKDAQSLPFGWNVMLNAVESFGILK